MQQNANSALKTVLNQILQAQSATKFKKPIKLIAVSKTKPAEEIQKVYEEGQRDFGENYVDELITKAAQLPKDIRWHFIGHLQSNKASQILKLDNLECIQSVDSLKLAQKLEKHCENLNRNLDIFVQVKLSEEISKTGAEPEQVSELVQEIISKFKRLRLIGLMTIGPQDNVVVFERLEEIKQKMIQDFQLKELQLSMGMSGDFMEAIKYGADVVRVGSAIFGVRVK